MRPLRYAINVTLDGCCDHQVGVPDAELHQFWADRLASADGLLYGRVTYQMMEEAWRRPASGTWPEWIDDDLVSFAETIDQATKYVVSGTLEEVDWRSELLRGDLRTEVERLKARPGGLLLTGGVTLPRALADLGLIDELELVVHPLVAGHGPTLLAGLAEPLDLELVERTQLSSGSVVVLYRVGR